MDSSFSLRHSEIGPGFDAVGGPRSPARTRHPWAIPAPYGRSSSLRSIGGVRQPRIRTTSHGQTTRKLPSLVLTWMSTVPTSVMVPTRVLPSFTLSPMWNSTSVPPGLLRRLRSCALVGTDTSRPSPCVVESGNGQLAADVPRKLASPIAPIDSVPNRVCVDDDADTVSIARAKQDGVADHRSARIASDNHCPPPPDRCVISATNRRPWLSTTSQQQGPRNWVMPSVWTIRRAFSSQWILATRRPSLVVIVHMATPAGVRPEPARLRRRGFQRALLPSSGGH
jgi:hypothetical protein